METFRSLLFLLTLSSFGRAFDCAYVQDQDSCTSLNGCTWTTDRCKGSFLPDCQVPDCYYVDPIDGSDSQDGQISTPFNSLMPAFEKLSSAIGSIIILNYQSKVEARILNYATIYSNITVRPLFTNNEYTISLANFDISSLPTNQSSPLTINSGGFTLIGCTINSRTSRQELASIFEVGNANLTFQNVDIVGSQGKMPLVVITADKPTASFKYLRGKHKDSSFWFKILAGTHIMRDLTIENNKAPDHLIYAGNKLSLSNIVVSKGASLLVKSMETTELDVNNVTVSNYMNGFLLAVNPKTMNIVLSKFRDIDLGSSTPLINIQITKESNIVAGTYYTNNTIFENISVSKSVVFSSIEISEFVNFIFRCVFFNITMKNITKKNFANSILSASDGRGGICIWAEMLQLILRQSTFTNISSHCVFGEKIQLTASGNIFNNSGLEGPMLKPSDIISDSQGISWISLRCYLPFQMGTSTISSNMFIENKILTRSGGALRYTGDCSYKLFIQDNEFIGNRALYGGAIYSENPQSQLLLGNNVFTKNSAEINGGAIYKESLTYRRLFNEVTSTVIIMMGKFDSNTASNKGGAIYLDWDSLILANSIFLNSSAKYGGALYFANLKTSMNNINKLHNNSFINNTATISGGAIKLLFDFVNMNITSPNLLLPYSYLCTSKAPPGCNITTNNLSLPSNFINNVDPKNRSISDSRPSTFHFFFYDILLPELKIAEDKDFDLWIHNATRTRLSGNWSNLDLPQNLTINHKSGHSLSQIILIEVRDQNDQLADYIFDEKVTLSITASQNSINHFEASLVPSVQTFTFNSGRIFMKSVVIVGHPNTKATLTIESLKDTQDILKNADLHLKQDIQIYFEPCEIGDVFQQTTHTCYTCPEKSYTLLDPYSSLGCIPCDTTTAVCPGGSRIAPKPGFWRYSNTSDNVMECDYKEACLGGLINDTYNEQGECAFPYQGNLCNRCVSGYAKFGISSNCADCKTDDWYYIRMGGFLLIQMAIALYAVKSQADKISEMKKSQTQDSADLKERIQNKIFQANLLKVAVNFLQSSTVVLTFQLEWPDFVNNMIGTANRMFPTSKDGFSIDCVLVLIKGDSENLFLTQFAASLVQPFGLWLLIVFCYALYLKVRTKVVFKNPRFKQTSFVLFLIIGFLLQPNIVQSALSLFSCRNLNSSDEPIYYMNGDTEFECWTPQHLIWCLAVSLPNLIAWAVVLPVILFIKITKHKKRLIDLEFAAKYSFVLQGLKNSYYYWEFVTLIRKVLLIVTSTLFSFLSKKSQAYAVFLVIATFTFFQFRNQPYLNKQVNRAELLSLISLSSLGLCGMFFVQKKSRQEIETNLFIALVCISNITFFGYLAFHFAKSYLKKVLDIIKRLQRESRFAKKDTKEEKVEGSINSATPVPCLSIEETEEKTPLPPVVNNIE